MKTFKQFLNEMALPLGKSPSEFFPPPGNYKAKDVLDSFLSIGKKIGKGSSRIAIKVDVESSQFTSPLPLSIKENSSGMISTVFKIALNSKGISQNQSEIRAFNKLKDSFDLILPVLDYSSKNHSSPLNLGGELYSHWVQFPLASPLSNSKKGLEVLDSFFIKLFGNLAALKTKEDHFRFTSPVTGKKKQFGFEIFDSNSFIKEFSKVKPQDGIITEQQINNLKSLYNFCRVTGISPTDFSNPENWGIIGDKIYILDYGFDQATATLYNNSKVKIKMMVSSDGQISLVKK